MIWWNRLSLETKLDPRIRCAKFLHHPRYRNSAIQVVKFTSVGEIFLVVWVYYFPFVTVNNQVHVYIKVKNKRNFNCGNRNIPSTLFFDLMLRRLIDTQYQFWKFDDWNKDFHAKIDITTNLELVQQLQDTFTNSNMSPSRKSNHTNNCESVYVYVGDCGVSSGYL